MLWSSFELIGMFLWYIYQLIFTRNAKSLKQIYKNTYNRDDILKGFSNETIYKIIGLTLFIIFVSIVYLKESLF